MISITYYGTDGRYYCSYDAKIQKLTNAAIRLWDNHQRCSVYINTRTVPVSPSTSSASKRPNEADKNILKLLDEKLRKVSCFSIINADDIERNIFLK